MNIAVLAGGLSTEREVSLSSASKICEALKRLGHFPALVDAFLGVNELPKDMDGFFKNAVITEYKVAENAPDISAVRASREDSGFGTLGKNVIEICRAADIVYMGLHGENGENGRMQAFFDVLEIKYTGCGYFASALAMNKDTAKLVMSAGGVKTPKGAVIKKGDNAPDFDFPCIVKPCSGGSSIGVFIVKDEKELETALCEAFKYEDEILVEEFIKGREFSVGMLGDTPLPPIEIIPEGGIYDYAHKYQAGLTREVCPADITAGQSEALMSGAAKAAKALGLEVYSRMDFILTEKGEVYCLEANTLPGMTPTSLIPQEAAAAGISYDELCAKVLTLSFAKYGDK